MPSLNQHIKALAQATGWSGLNTPKANFWQVHLDKDLTPVFFQLGDQKIVLRGQVMPLPLDLAEKTALIKRIAALTVAMMHECSSIIALEKAGESLVQGLDDSQDAVICLRILPLNIDDESFLAQVQDWLDDYDWWKKTLSQAESPSTMGNLFSSVIFEGLKL